MSQTQPNIPAPQPDTSAPLTSLEDLVGFNDDLGLHLTEWSDGAAKMELDLVPRLLNRSGIVHGGLLMTVLDATCGFTGVWRPEGEPKCRALSLSISTNFIGQTKAGRVTCLATRTGGGRRIFFARGEVFSDDGTLLATGEGTFRIRDEKPE